MEDEGMQMHTRKLRTKGEKYKPNGQNIRKKPGMPMEPLRENTESRGGRGYLWLAGSRVPKVWLGFGQVEMGMGASL